MKSRRYFVFTFCAFAATVFVALPTAQAAKQLRWSLMEGDRFEVEMKQEMKQILTVMDNTVELPTTLTMYMSWQVEDVADNGAITIAQTIDRIKMSIKAPIGDVVYDSDSRKKLDGPAKTIADMLEPMVDAKFTNKMSDRGEIIDVEVPKEAFKGLEANPVLKDFFSSKSFRDMMRQASPVFPEAAIDEGFDWSNETEVKTPVGTMKMDATYTYQGEEELDERTVDKVGAKLKIEFSPDDGPLAAKIEITDQDNSGTIYFDSEGGHLSSTSMKQRLTMKVTVGDTTVDQKIETTVSMTVKKK